MKLQNPPTVIVLAAGRGQRFIRPDDATHKLDALLDGVPVLERVLRSVADSGLPYHVVRPADPQAGMGDSIARGVTATADASGWLILPGDLPLVTPDSLLKVAQGLTAQPVVIPFWRGKQGHPVGFDQECRTALMSLSGDTGAAAIVRQYRQTAALLELHLDDPGIVTDIDTREDLARAEALLTHQDT